MDPALLQKLREQSGLRLDREGRFWHRGGEITHARTLAVLHKGIHRAPDGRWATRIGPEWGYLDVEDAAFFVRRLEGLRAQLASGEWVPVDPDGLAVGREDALYLRIRGERAKLTRQAQLALSDALQEEGDGFSISLEGRRVPIGKDTGPEPVRPPS